MKNNKVESTDTIERIEELTWLKDCEICNVGVCKQMDKYQEQGMSERAASRQMEKDCDGIWDADKIYGRYRYYKKGHSGGVGKTHKLSDDEILKRAEEITEQRFLEWLSGMNEIRLRWGISLLKKSLGPEGIDCSQCDEIDHCSIRATILKLLENRGDALAALNVIKKIRPECWFEED